MDYLDSLNFIVTSATRVLLIYICMFVFVLGQRYLKLYSRNKILRFTQEEVKEKKKEITNLKMAPVKQDISYEKRHEFIYELFGLYNELAVGINEGLYDELYVKMVMGNEMMVFYKRNNKDLLSSMGNDTIFMPLELLLKKWDSNDSPSYIVKDHRRYM